MENRSPTAFKMSGLKRKESPVGWKQDVLQQGTDPQSGMAQYGGSTSTSPGQFGNAASRTTVSSGPSIRGAFGTPLKTTTPEAVNVTQNEGKNPFNPFSSPERGGWKPDVQQEFDPQSSGNFGNMSTRAAISPQSSIRGAFGTPLKTPTSAVDEARIGGGFDVNRTLFDTFSPCGMRDTGQFDVQQGQAPFASGSPSSVAARNTNAPLGSSIRGAFGTPVSPASVEEKPDPENKLQVNRNPFNPLSTPERGGKTIKNPESPPYLGAQTNNQKLETDFQSGATLGTGQFGSVQKHIGKLDGIAYAIKSVKLKRLAQKTMVEIYALAALGSHPHIIRYCGSWVSGRDVLIQTELCNGGSLEDVLEDCVEKGKKMEEDQLKQVLLHIGSGLKFMHSQGMVHNDIKPGNILIHNYQSKKFKRPDPDSASLRDIFEDARILGGYPDGPYSAEECERNNMPVYKIGDLGLAYSSDDVPGNPDGDPRYNTRKEGYRTKADVFALGLSVYECARGFPLQMPGSINTDFFALRDGRHFENKEGDSNYHQLLGHCSQDFRDLIIRMTDQKPERRPSAASLVSHELLNPAARHLRLLRRQLEMNQQEYDALCSTF